ncbi:hypothetical protein GGF32_006358 [Allomyces javanicus]|nr:hypothetical protein GGF32_006358 [Allomyces javanicus]
MPTPSCRAERSVNPFALGWPVPGTSLFGGRLVRNGNTMGPTAQPKFGMFQLPGQMHGRFFLALGGGTSNAVGGKKGDDAMDVDEPGK